MARQGAAALHPLGLLLRASTARPLRVSRELHNAPIAVVDEDHTALSQRIASAFYRPTSCRRRSIDLADIDRGHGHRALHVRARHPAGLPARRAGRPAARRSRSTSTPRAMTRPSSAPPTSRTSCDRGRRLLRRRARRRVPAVRCVRAKFNPNLNGTWFGGVMQIINNITMLSVILTGAGADPRARARHARAPAGDAADALRDHGWPRSGRTAWWSLAAAALSLVLVVQGALGVPIAGSVPLFLAGARLTCSRRPRSGSCSPPSPAPCRSSACW